MPNYGLGPRPGGNASKLNLTSTAVVKSEPGTLYQVNINVGSSASVCALYDAVTTSTITTNGVTAANLILSVAPSTTGSYELTWPCFNGIVAVVGTGAVLAVAYE